MSRILTRQRQMAEQGRLRLGYTTAAKNGKTRPAASQTWIVTSHSEEHIRAAAELWGGEVERWQPQGYGAEQWRVTTETTVIDALLPPGDPLTQAYESWTKGGCQRRCNGVTEELSGSPCVCLAEFGDRWYEQPPEDVCVNKSRLKVILPDMPGLGVWRMETGSHYAMDEIAGLVDTVRYAVGEQALVPVRLRIEPRSRTVAGKTKHWLAPIVQVRGATFGELLAGGSPVAVEGRPQRGAVEQSERAAIEAPAEQTAVTVDSVTRAAEMAPNRDVFRQAWNGARDAGLLNEDLKTRLREIAAKLPTGEPAEPAQEATPEPTQEVTPQANGPADVDELWPQIVTAAGAKGFNRTDDIEAAFAQRYGGVMPGSGTPAQLQQFLVDMQADQVKPGQPADEGEVPF